MSPVVLCHGAWGGSYGFRAVRPLLWRAGREVFTPSLTGIGERAHLTGPMVGLDTHILDVVNTIVYEDLTDIALLGFSYGGMVVTGALDHIGDRVRHLVYLDAFVPEEGQTTLDLFGLDPPSPSNHPGTSWTMAPVPRRLDTPQATAWSEARRSPQPLATFSQPVRLSKPLEQWPFTLTYIKATAEPGESPDSAFNQAACRARNSERWTYHEIASTHLVPMTHPTELADILLSLG